MKNSTIYASALGILLTAVSSTALTSCDDDFERPPVVAPESEWVGMENTTVAQLKELFWQNQNNYATPIGKNENGEDMIVKARVISTDINSTIYQYIYLQDETGGMSVSARQLSSKEKLATQYGYAQEVYFNVTGLYAGRYSGLFQIGALNTEGNGTTFMTNEVLVEHMQANGLGQPEKIEVMTKTIPELNAALGSQEDLESYMARAVRIEGVHFAEPGKAFIPVAGADANITFLDDAGNSMIIRLNRYCTFGSTLVPEGTGTINGVLGYFKDGWQMVINSIDDLEGFTFSDEGGDSGSTPAGVVCEESFASSLGSFTIEDTELSEALNHVWSIDTKYSCVKASSFVNNTNNKCESWLVSPVIDLGGKKEASLTFEQAFSKHFGSTDPEAMEAAKKVCTVWAREEGKEWQPLTGYTYPTQPWNFNFGTSGKVSLADFDGKKVQVGFRYFVEATSTSGAGTWELKNFKVTAK